MNNFSFQPAAAAKAPLAKAPFNYGYIMVIACFTLTLLNVGCFVTMGVFFKPILNDFGWSRGVTALPLSLSTLVTGVFFLLTGTLADKFGPRLIITICVAVSGLGYILMSRLDSIWQLYLYISVMAALGSSALVPMQSAVTRWFRHRRTIMMGVIAAGGGVGGLCIPLIADWLIRTYNWRTAFLVLGIVYLVLTVTAAQLLKRNPQTEATVADAKAPAPASPVISMKSPRLPEKAKTDSIKNYIRSPRFWLINLVFGCCGATVLVVQFHIVNHATDINISTTAAAGMLSIVNGVSILGSIILGACGDRFGNRALLITAMVVMGLSMLSLLFLDSLWQLYVYAVFFGLALGAMQSNGPALVSKLFGTGSLGLILGVASLCQTSGGAVSGFVAGYIFDLQNSYNTMFIICSLICLAGMIAAWFLKPSKDDH